MSPNKKFTTSTTTTILTPTVTNTFTRMGLESALTSWAKQHEGLIAFECVSSLIDNGELLQALNLTASSMQEKQALFTDTNACLIWSAWMNFQEYGSPGFTLSKEELDM